MSLKAKPGPAEQAPPTVVEPAGVDVKRPAVAKEVAAVAATATNAQTNGSENVNTANHTSAKANPNAIANANANAKTHRVVDRAPVTTDVVEAVDQGQVSQQDHADDGWEVHPRTLQLIASPELAAAAANDDAHAMATAGIT